MPSQGELDAYYQGFAYSKPGEGEFARQLAYTEAGTSRATKKIATHADRAIHTVLDFGGGLGFFANALSRHYPDVTLFDLDKQSRDFARECYGERFQVLETAEEALASRYDMILLNQVIEHVPDPVGLLALLRTALEPGGLLVVTTPNNRSNDRFARPDVLVHYARALSAGPIAALKVLARDSWLCCDPPRHLFAFNAKNLCSTAELAGYRSLASETAYFDVDPFGQPKYAWQGFRSLRSAVLTVLYLFTKVTSPVARLTDRAGGKGSTLIGYFTI